MVKKKEQTKKKIQTKGKEQIKFIGQVTKIRQNDPATVIEWPPLNDCFWRKADIGPTGPE